MKKEKVITYHRVQVKDDLPEEHVAYDFRGRKGTIQHPTKPYGATDAVPVKLDGDETVTRYFKAEWLDDITKPAPEAGDHVYIKAKVVRRDGDDVEVVAEDPAWPILHRDDVQIRYPMQLHPVEVTPPPPPEPEIRSIVRTTGGKQTWWRFGGATAKRWMDLTTGTWTSWPEIVEKARTTGDALHIYEENGKFIPGKMK